MCNNQKFIIDTDIGDDIDDAIALYSAMKRGFSLVGVTTVFRNTADRARQVKKLMTGFGKGYENVPVLAGLGVPFGTEPTEYPVIPHHTPEMDDDKYAPDNTDPEVAVDFIIDSCKRYRDELTIIAIGPFTNIARAIQKDPEALNMAKSVIIMGGAFYKQYADWNVMCDVTAADIMFKGLNNLECIGADVTHLMLGEDELYNSLFDYNGSDECRRYLKELCLMWKKDRPKSPLLLHDPLVIYYAEDKSICQTENAPIAVLTEGFAKGMTLNVKAYSKKWLNEEAYTDFDVNHTAAVAKTADREKFNTRILADYSGEAPAGL